MMIRVVLHPGCWRLHSISNIIYSSTAMVPRLEVSKEGLQESKEDLGKEENRVLADMELFNME